MNDIKLIFISEKSTTPFVITSGLPNSGLPTTPFIVNPPPFGTTPVPTGRATPSKQTLPVITQPQGKGIGNPVAQRQAPPSSKYPPVLLSSHGLNPGIYLVFWPYCNECSVLRSIIRTIIHYLMRFYMADLKTFYNERAALFYAHYLKSVGLFWQIMGYLPEAWSEYWLRSSSFWHSSPLVSYSWNNDRLPHQVLGLEDLRTPCTLQQRALLTLKTAGMWMEGMVGWTKTMPDDS